MLLIRCTQVVSIVRVSCLFQITLSGRIFGWSAFLFTFLNKILLTSLCWNGSESDKKYAIRMRSQQKKCQCDSVCRGLLFRKAHHACNGTVMTWVSSSYLHLLWIIISFSYDYLFEPRLHSTKTGKNMTNKFLGTFSKDSLKRDALCQVLIWVTCNLQVVSNWRWLPKPTEQLNC